MNTPSRPSALASPRAKHSVVSFVLARIKEAIMRGELRPGDLLPSESELMASLGVGKTSIREALKMLQAVGAVEIRQGHGTVICKEPGADILTPLVFQLLLKEGTSAELIEFRRLVEPSYSFLALEKATDADISKLETSVRALEAGIARGHATVEDDLAFHRIILEMTRNPYMIAIGNTILELFRSSIERSIKEIPDVAATDHRAILEAFKSRDADMLKTAIEISYRGWSRSLRAESATK